MNNTTYSHNAAGFLPSFGRSNGTLASLLKTISAWDSRSRQRRKLAEMEDHLLADLGISRREAAIEAAKPFWQA